MTTNKNAVVPETLSAEVDVRSEGFDSDVLKRRLLSMNDGSAVVSSFQTDDFATKAKVAQAVTSAEPLADHLGKELTLRNYVGQVIELPDEETGVLRAVPRIILLCDEGQFYAISSGILSALENLTGVLGEPHSWPIGAKVIVEAVQERTRAKRNVFTLKLVRVETGK